MAKRLSSVDFNNIQSLNFKLQNAAGGIASPAAGSAYFDTSAGKPLFHNGTAFLDLTARANHTGTQLAATISNFDTQVRTSSLDQMTIPAANLNINNRFITNVGGLNLNSSSNINMLSGCSINLNTASISAVSGACNIDLSGGTGYLKLSTNGGLNANSGPITSLGHVTQNASANFTFGSTGTISANGNRIQNLAAPVSANDGARLIDVQSAAAGIDSKASVRFASTGSNINIATGGLIAIDGGTSVIAGDRVLLKDQTLPAENGVYIAAAGAWARAADADITGEITPGAFWYVEEGTALAATQWRCSNTGTITLGTTGITIQQFGAAAVYTASNGVLKTGNNFTGVVEANKGLSVGASGFAVVPNGNAGMEVTASGVGVKILAAGGLAFDPSGMQLKLPGSSGLSLSASGVQIDTNIVVKKYAATIGDGVTTSIAVSHGLGTKDVTVSVRDVATDTVVDCEWASNSTASTTLTFPTAPANSSLRVVIHG